MLAAAAELEHLGLDDALRVLELIAAEGPGRYAPAAARFMQRLAGGRALTLEQQRRALAALELLPLQPRTASVLEDLLRVARAAHQAHRGCRSVPTGQARPSRRPSLARSSQSWCPIVGRRSPRNFVLSRQKRRGDLN